MEKTALNASDEITAYIDGLPEFSRPMCVKLRSVILSAVPGIEEDWKWGPHYKFHGMVCGFGAFKQHVKVTFFNGSAMTDPKGLFNHCVDNEFSRSIKYTDISEIDEPALKAYVKESAAINKKGFKREVKDKTVIVPDDLQQAFNKNKGAKSFFDKLTYGYRKEYVEWVTTAKQATTRNERISKTVAKCAANERLNDKYKK